MRVQGGGSKWNYGYPTLGAIEREREREKEIDRPVAVVESQEMRRLFLENLMEPSLFAGRVPTKTTKTGFGDVFFWGFTFPEIKGTAVILLILRYPVVECPRVLPFIFWLPS